jgi:shikimate kinase
MRRMILKLKRTPGLFIVGQMGAGKSTVGRALARQLGWRFADLDEDIPSREQMSIPEIFEKRGEAEFRRAEHEALKKRIEDVSRGIPWVIAVGGGCFAQPENVDLIQNHGVTIWLDAPLEMLRARVSGAVHRPLARDPVHFEKLFHQRRPVYERADYRIAISSGGSDAAVEEILKLPLF